MVFSAPKISNAGTTGNKAFKVCPDVVTAKDTPCRSLGATAALATREMIAVDKVNEDTQKINVVIKLLRDLADQLEKESEASKGSK